MDGVHAARLGGGDDAIDVEVGGDRPLALADLVRLVRLEPMQCVTIFVRVNGHGPNAKLMSGPTNSNSDLTAVGNEQLANGLHTGRVLCKREFGMGGNSTHMSAFATAGGSAMSGSEG